MSNKFEGTPLRDDIWFKSHQALLLRVLETEDGRDLLCIPKDFPVITEIGEHYIKGTLDEDNDIYNFHTADKFANVIRHRWKEFGEYARKYYDNGDLTNIHLDGEQLLAATTYTFYPQPHPETVTVDGYAFHFESNASWASVIAGAGVNYNDNAATGWAVRGVNATTTDKYTTLLRSAFLFNTAPLGVEVEIASAKFSVDGISKVDQPSATPNIAVYASNPASNTAIVAGDFDSFGSTILSDIVTYAGFNDSGKNDFNLNAAGIAAINGGGISKLGLRNEEYDVGAVAPPWTSGSEWALSIKYAETTGTSEDPVLEIISAAVKRNRYNIGGKGDIVIRDSQTANDIRI